MEKQKDIYLVCPRLKSQKKKHVRVCRQCRWNRSCRTYQDYSQISLPIAKTAAPQSPSASMPFQLVSIAPADKPAPSLLEQIQQELLAIRDMLA